MYAKDEDSINEINAEEVQETFEEEDRLVYIGGRIPNEEFGPVTEADLQANSHVY